MRVRQSANCGDEKRSSDAHKFLILCVQRVMAVADSSGDGLISFEEYVFFTTLLSIPSKYFEIAFRVMDVNNDDQVDAEEFRKVMRCCELSLSLYLSLILFSRFHSCVNA